MEIEFDKDSSLQVQAMPELILPDEFRRQRSAMRQEAHAILSHAQTITTLAGDDAYQHAIQVGRALQATGKTVEEFYKPIKQGFDAKKQVVLDMEHEDADPIKAIKRTIAGLVQAYEDEQAAEARRRAAEERAAALEAAKQTEDDLFSPGPVVVLPAPVIAQAPMKAKGKIDRSKWRGRVDNFFLLVVAVAKGEVPINALQWNQSYLDKRADSDHEGLNFPGVTAYKESNVHFRA